MFKTVWVKEYYSPPLPDGSANDRDAIANFLAAHGPSTAKAMSQFLRKSEIATRHTMWRMKKRGVLVNRRLGPVGSPVYWALCEEDLDKLQGNPITGPHEGQIGRWLGKRTLP